MRIDQIIGAVVGGLGSGINTSNPMANHYLQYVVSMAEQAFARWSAVSQSGMRCQIGQHTDDGQDIRCTAPAIAGCMVCGANVCLHHALVSPKYVMCFACAEGAARAAAARSPRTEQKSSPFGFVDPDEAEAKDEALRKKHLKTLGLEGDPTDEEVKAAFKRLVLEHHPDRAPQHKKAAKHKKLREINEAYTWLTQQRKKAAA